MKDETLATIGTLLTKPMLRDAVHIAVVQCRSDGWETLKPGQPVRIGGDYIAGQDFSGHGTHGIVDPYLQDDIAPGSSFWVFLHPNTITSLKHVWTHPDLPDTTTKHPSGIDFGEAEAHLRQCAEEWGVRDFTDLLQGIVNTAQGIPTMGITVQDWSDLTPEEYRKFWNCAEVLFDEKFSPDHREKTHFECCA